ncbi:MAG: immunoglobulin domain-containing protein, partial [Chloroflexi bacterium]|nr:immunoglobulin domain-containing protein [Chloroflexota bacterium]
MKPTPLLLTCLICLAVPLVGLAQPTITTHPESQSVSLGANVTFSVIATGTAPLAYQWQKFLSAWSDLADRTNTTLLLTNVQSTHAGDYRVVVTNVEGAVTSAAAHLTALVPPRITPTVALQHTAVVVGSTASFSVTSSGTAPLSYQWRLDGREVLGQTNKTLTLASTQPADEGDYTVVVTNGAGSVISDPARLWVAPPMSSFIRGDFTNQAGQRLPYFYLLPTNYDAARSYPLFCNFHGSAQHVDTLRSSGLWWGWLASDRQQTTDPVILVLPTRWKAGEDWTDQYLQLTSGMLDRLMSQFNIDTNRVYVAGGSQGVHAAWDLLGMRPGFFAAARVAGGWMGKVPATAIKDMPLWVGHAADDEMVNVGDSRTLVATLRRAGGNPIYTEYSSGGHVGGIDIHLLTPAVNDWLLAQRRGVAPTNEPLLSITSPTREAIHATGATNLNLGGAAAALGRAVTKVAWENRANGAKGTASGTNIWSATGVPLRGSQTNLITVTATTTSWAPAYGGNTTFND